MVGSTLSNLSSPSRGHDDSPTRAVILAAGRGNRLRPWTDVCPKPLLEVRGQPILHWILDALMMASVGEVCLVVNHLAEQIKSYVGNGSQWNMRVVFRRQKALRGTADALNSVADYLTETVFVLAADYALDRGYLTNLKSAYQNTTADVVISIKRPPRDELSQRSSVQFDRDGRIVSFIEKPDIGTEPSPFAASVIMIVPKDIRLYLPRVKPSTRGEYELLDALNLMLADGFVMDGIQQPVPQEFSARRTGYSDQSEAARGI